MIRFLEIRDASQSIQPVAKAPSRQLWANYRPLEQQVEKQHSDYMLSCARITSINLGLRGKYGWVICGNSLSRDVQFVHRIGSFFHEGPNGLRRGVIREVPPEECPVLPELMRATKADLLTELGDPSAGPVTAEWKVPAIIEIPRWVLRLEQQTTAAEVPDARPHEADEASPTTSEQPTQGTDRPQRPEKQGRLFD